MGNVTKIVWQCHEDLAYGSKVGLAAEVMYTDGSVKRHAVVGLKPFDFEAAKRRILGQIQKQYS